MKCVDVPRSELLIDFLNTARDLGRLAAEMAPPPALPPLPCDEAAEAYRRSLPQRPVPGRKGFKQEFIHFFKKELRLRDNKMD